MHNGQIAIRKAFGSGKLKTENLKGVRVSVGLKIIHWNPYATTVITTRIVNISDLHYKILIYQLILYNR